MALPKRILVPIDFSEHSQRALKYAIEVAKQSGAKIYLLHVVEQKLVQCIDDYCLNEDLIKKMAGQVAPSSTDDTAFGEMIKQVEAEWLKNAKEKIQSLLSGIAEAKGLDITADVRSGIPYHEIVQEQKARDIDTIIMPSQGKTGIQSFYLGSTSEKVVRHAPCTVTVVR
jgi:universal stress protein A